MFGKIKIRESDRLYSLLLRRERPACERCGSKNGLQVSHFYGRANEATRFLNENCDIMCFGCHQYFTANPNEYREWKFKRMGERAFKQLVLAANTYKKRDDKLEILWLSKELGMKEKPKYNKECEHKRKMCVLCHSGKKKKGRNY